MMSASIADIRYLTNPDVIAKEMKKLYDWSPDHLKRRFKEFKFPTQWHVDMYVEFAYHPVYAWTRNFTVRKRK